MKIGTVYSSHLLPSIAGIIIVSALAVYSFRQRNMPGAMAFSIACTLGLLWLLGMIFEDIAPALETKIFWRKFQVIWQLPSATAITIFLLEYSQPKRWTTPRNIILLSIPPLLIFGLVFTNDFHHLFWEGFVYRNALVALPGPMMRYFIFYVYVNFLLNLVVLIWLFVHSPQNRWPVAFIILGQSVMRLFYIIEFINKADIEIPYSPIGITFTCVMYAIVLFRFRIFGPLPLARQILNERMPVGVLVLDHENKVRSLNPAAEKILQTSVKAAKGRAIGELLSAYPQELPAATEEQRMVFSLPAENDLQFYELVITNLQNWRDLSVGKLLLINNVTEQRRTQQNLMEQQRVLATLKEREQLAREMHDDFAQVLGFINTQCQTVSRLLKKGDQASAATYLDKLVEVAKEVDVDIRDSIQGMRAAILEDGLLITVEKYLARYQKEHGIQTQLINPEIIADKNIAPIVEIQVFRIMQEALTNVRKHAEANQVKIKFEAKESALCISIEDDGRGFDLSEHSSNSTNHFGLQMIRERAEAIGGSLRLSSQIGFGTQIEICVPTQLPEVA